jgi:alpha-ketoglutarate-dependent taurine dioxygenase
VAFTITPLTDHTGAEGVGLDFTRPTDTEARASLSHAFAERHVLVMRDQHFSPEEFKAAAQVFGELQPHDKKENHVPGHPDVYAISRRHVSRQDADGPCHVGTASGGLEPQGGRKCLVKCTWL